MKNSHSLIPRILGLSLLLVAVGARADTYPIGQADTQLLDDGLVAYYPFNGNANDGSGNGHHGTVYGATLTEDRFGNVLHAYDFDGVDDYILVSDPYDWSLTDTFTLAGWFKPGIGEGGRTVLATVDNGALSPGWAFMPRPSHNDIYFLATSGTNTWDLVYTSVGVAFTPGQWYCFAVARSDSVISISIDGTRILTTTNSNHFATSNSLYISGFSNRANAWSGSLDDIRIYDRALSESEIQDLCDIENVYLPLVVHNYTDFPLYIGDAIPAREANYAYEIFYTTSLYMPSTLPSGGHFYLSSQPNAAAEVLVDDEIAIMSEGVDVWTYNFSTSGLPQPAVPEVPRPTMEQLAGQTITIEYRDVYGSFVQASTVWLIWTP